MKFGERVVLWGIALVFIGVYYGILFAMPNNFWPAPVTIAFQLVMIGLVTLILGITLVIFKEEAVKE